MFLESLFFLSKPCASELDYQKYIWLCGTYLVNETAQRGHLKGPIHGGLAEGWRLGVQMTLRDCRCMGKICEKKYWAHQVVFSEKDGIAGRLNLGESRTPQGSICRAVLVFCLGVIERRCNLLYVL